MSDPHVRPRPAGRSLRHPTDADALAVVELLRARERADLGREQATVEDLREDWAVAGFDLATDAWLAEEDGTLAGYAFLLGDDLLVAVHPDAAGRGIGSRLREAGERRAEERGTRVLRQFIPVAERARACSCSTRAGGRCTTTSASACRSSAPPTPPDVIVRRFDAAADLEPVWRLVQDTYASLEGFLSQPLEAWRATTLDKPGWDPALWLVLHDREGLAGVALGERGPRDTGLVHTLAVAERARGRGHGHTLILLLFDAFRSAGLTGAAPPCTGPTPARRRSSRTPG